VSSDVAFDRVYGGGGAASLVTVAAAAAGLSRWHLAPARRFGLRSLAPLPGVVLAGIASTEAGSAITTTVRAHLHRRPRRGTSPITLVLVASTLLIRRMHLPLRVEFHNSIGWDRGYDLVDSCRYR